MEKKLSLARNGVIRLPPGFRFHPTDEELVVQYLRRKVFGCPLPASIIPEVDLCKHDPWNLPGDLEQERYYFSTREPKYRNGNRPNRATVSGYWKATGLDKKIVAPKTSQLVGMKKTLVFYRGKPSNATRTDWIMHEYRLVDVANQKSIMEMEDWVLCRIFLKKRSTKNGDNFGRGGPSHEHHEEQVDLTLGRPSFIDFMKVVSNSSSTCSSSPASSGVTEVSSTGSYSGDSGCNSISSSRNP